MRSPSLRLATALASLAATLGAGLVSHSAEREIEFNRDIRPILSDNCYPCHGPDRAKRITALRFDQEEAALADLGGGRHAIVRGDPAASEMIRRITASDPAERMPPARAERTLSPQQIERLRAWIAAGARWQQHWSFIPPRRPELPRVARREWVRNPIDAFVLERLEREGLTPAPEADRAALIRRVTLDLTGLPPTPAEVDAFAADASPDAYDRVVDRLLG